MPLILSIETSSKSCSAAVHQDGILLAVTDLLHDKSSAAMLTTVIDDTLKITGHTFQDLDAVAVAKGPGSFTGLRIAVSTAKGLCFAIDKPLLAVNTLEAMAQQMMPFFKENTLLCPMLDARRMEVYCAIFEAKTGQIVQATEAKIIEEDAFQDLLAKQKMVFFGDGADKCKATLGQHANAIFIDNIYPSARTIGFLAEKRCQEGFFEDLATFEPYYLKEFVGTKKKEIVN